ncbi:MAG: hypothetical protein ABSD58_08050 [Verrucomicrobiia bacterium]
MAGAKYISANPKAALIRYTAVGRSDDVQWRLWIGSRNLTQAINWEAGLVIVSRADGRGRQVIGVPELGGVLAERARLNGFEVAAVRRELANLTWECPSGVEVRSVRLLGPEFDRGLPEGMLEATEVCLVSPFLDLTTVKAVAKWGGKGVHRTILSTPAALNTVASRDATVFGRSFHEVLRCGVPELVAVGCDPLADETPLAVKTTEDEDLSPSGLHAKLLYASRGSPSRPINARRVDQEDVPRHPNEIEETFDRRTSGAAAQLLQAGSDRRRSRHAAIRGHQEA